VTLAGTQGSASAAARTLAPVILCADDYAITDGVSRGIEELARARRISATGALVTTPAWADGARRLASLSPTLAVGLHLNLTMDRPLGPMPVLAPNDMLPDLPRLLRLALTWQLPQAEIAAEIGRQLDQFIQHTGRPPDFVDGHQHVHALPGIRDMLLKALTARFLHRKPLLRDPGDSPRAILGRGGNVTKAMGVALLSLGFGTAARHAGFQTNAGFAGFSAFDQSRPFAEEIAAFLRYPGARHLVMCHPGYPDEALARLDPVVARRRDELEALLALPELESRIWHPTRDADGTLRWPGGDTR
jgi:chitin disaccharide deacetylase